MPSTVSGSSDPDLALGTFEILAAQRVLRVGGQPVSVGARAFDLLLCLARHRDRVVSKQELLDEVWPGLVVEEHNIATQIGTLRKLLGAQVIATVPGRGYRLAVPAGAGQAAAPSGVQLPAQAPHAAGLVPLLGRAQDQAAITARFEHSRLVSVVGAGGMGKSLLARHLLNELATRWPNGACWVDLASTVDELQLPARVAETVGVRVAGADPLAALATAMAGLQMLVVLDNAEHLSAAVAKAATALLKTAPGLRLLVTSQQPLHVAQESVYRLEPLATPTQPLPAAAALNYAAVALFVQRARDADRHFEFGDTQAAQAIDLCRQLDGLPLAIELAAARATLLGVQRLHSMMQSRLQLLTRNPDSQAPARQQTLRATLEWSCSLLGPTLSKVYRRLGVIVDSASLALIQHILADDSSAPDPWGVIDALDTLVDRSLVVVVPMADEEPRYRLLETPRAFALEQLSAAGEREFMQRRHALAVAAQFDAAWAERSSGHTRIRRWEARVMQDAGNARAALDWAVAAGEATLVAQIAPTLYLGLPRQTHFERIRLGEWCEAMAGRAEGAELQRRAWLTATRASFRSATHRSVGLAERALAVAREMDVGAADHWPLYETLSLWVTAAARHAQRPLPELLAALAEIGRIEEPGWPPHRLFEGLESRRLAEVTDDPLQELELVRRCVATFDAAGGDGELWTPMLIDAEVGCGELRAAIERGEQALQRQAAQRDELILWQLLGNLALACLLARRTQRARQLLLQVWPIDQRYGGSESVADLLALLAAQEGRPHAAALLLGRADAMYASRDLWRAGNEAAVRQHCSDLVGAALGQPEANRLMASGGAMSDAQVAEQAFASLG